MKILLVNDDGIEAKGLQTIGKRLSQKHEVYVVAPDSQCSAFSHSATYFFRPVKAYRRQYDWAKEAWAMSGTPADCVYLALHGILKNQNIDVVVSGINQGLNVSYDCLYSGTVGAATEGLVHGIPAIAVSLDSYEKEEFDVAAEIASSLLDQYMVDENRFQYVLNINIPYMSKEEIKGIRKTGFDLRRNYKHQLNCLELSDQCFEYSIADWLEIDEKDVKKGDLSFVKEGYVTVTALQLDWEHKEIQEQLSFKI